MLYRYFADSYQLIVLVVYLLFGVADFLVADQLTPFVEDGTVLVLLSVSPPWQSKMKKTLTSIVLFILLTGNLTIC